MFDASLLLQVVLAVLAAVALYTLIGFIPGTDETSVLLPVTLTLALSGAPPEVILAFFIAAITTLNLTNAIPTALVGLPGGVLSTPMIDYGKTLLAKGRASEAIRKMAAGSVIGTVIAVPIALLCAHLLRPYGQALSQYASLVFVIGAVVLALLGKNRVLQVLSIGILAVLFASVPVLFKAMGVLPQDGKMSVTFFLSITLGPLLVSLIGLLDARVRKTAPRLGRRKVIIDKQELRGFSLSPAKIVTKQEAAASAGASVVGSVLFFLSPVALTFLLGEATAARVKNAVAKASMAVTSMSATAHATYLGGTIIPLIAIGLPLSPVAVGPANPLFTAEPRYDTGNNLHQLLSFGQASIVIVLAAVISLALSYILAVKYSVRITAFVMKYIPHEAVLALFVCFVAFLAYREAGVANLFAVLLVGIVTGTLNKFGVSYGVQFMTLYATPWLVELVTGLAH